MDTSGGEHRAQHIASGGVNGSVDEPLQVVGEVDGSSEDSLNARTYACRTFNAHRRSTHLLNREVVHIQIVGIVAVIVDGNILGCCRQRIGHLGPIGGNRRVVANNGRESSRVVGSSGNAHAECIVGVVTLIPEFHHILVASRQSDFRRNQELVVVRCSGVAAESESAVAFVGLARDTRAVVVGRISADKVPARILCLESLGIGESADASAAVNGIDSQCVVNSTHDVGGGSDNYVAAGGSEGVS